MKRLSPLFFAFLTFGANVTAYANPTEVGSRSLEQGTPAEGDLEMSGFRDLMAVMEEATMIATKTKMNADFVPGMVTVLYGNDLEAKGVKNLIEALSLVPGLHGSFNSPVVRGVDKWGSGKVKLLLNGTPINHSVSANPSPPMYLPIQAIDRIEIIRGPGSAVYGEYAFLGVVNIITRTEGNRAYGSFGSYKTFAGGGIYSYANPENGLKMNLNLAGYSSIGEHVMSGEDVLYSPSINQPDASYAPGPVNDRKRQRTSIFTLDYQPWTVEAKFLDNGSGDVFGTANALPPQDERLVWSEELWGLQIHRHMELLPHVTSTVSLGHSEYTMAMDHLNFFPPGNAAAPMGLVTMDKATGELLFHPDGVVANNMVREERTHGGMEHTWTGWNRHQILIGLDFATMKLAEAWSEANIDPLTLEPLPWHRTQDEKAWIKKGVSRDVYGVSVQDQFAITDQLDLTTGVRFDAYDDVGNSLTPRIGMVYRLTNTHILKAQYGRAFRPPTFMEMYSNNFVISGNPHMKPETIDAYELGYIYRDPTKVGRITLFYSTLKDLISGSPTTGQFENFPGAKLQGVELEMEYAINEKIKLDANISYVDTKDEETGAEMESSANWLGNAGVLWHPMLDITLSTRYQYVGPRNRAITDPRNKLGDDNVVNLTGTVDNIFQKNLTLHASVNNIFDASVKEPASPDLPQDFPMPGRSWGLNLTYDF